MEVVFIWANYEKNEYIPEVFTELITLPDDSSPTAINEALEIWSDDKGLGDYSWEYKED